MSGPIKVVVHFDDGVPDDVQSQSLFNFEIDIRKLSGLDIRVLKDRMADDSPLRKIMDMRRGKKNDIKY